MKTKEKIKRGNYNEIYLSNLSDRQQLIVKNLVKEAARSEKIDEHGNWEFGAEFDKKGRGSALNWDLYGYGQDFHNRRFLVVIQVRQYIKSNKNYPGSTRKATFS